MTVAEVIAELQKFPPGTEMATDLHSEFTRCESVYSMLLRDNGGYLTRAYSDADKALAVTYVYIG